MHSALNKKSKISDGRAVVRCADHSSTPYVFELALRERKQRRKKVREEKKRKMKNKSEIFTFAFHNCERISGTEGVQFPLE